MSINRIDSDTYTYNLIKRGLDATSIRGQVISNNMANINTANYKKSNVSFEDSLKDVTGDMEQDGYVQDDSNSLGTITVQKDNSTSMRSDGNNVDLDVEKVNQAANTMMYNALVTEANNRLNITKSIIAGR
ncbi:flagellar basal body rod protein FlgB [Inconstantimicrobium mannanitabidum]|uniref:Flagellar basal body rod protein FlgB n=1 Tax=Inconstantimicrobium mannanitabidum TaxID=1604901 RepID=A0ACB5R8H0_9CLOT|nr:flagellar basal body rod protein FlgB [Clostridium sp. TW13]GKX65483.1 flagellar basal body rod protein FlgB [Clostridium sp. TW13]